MNRIVFRLGSYLMASMFVAGCSTLRRHDENSTRLCCAHFRNQTVQQPCLQGDDKEWINSSYGERMNKQQNTKQGYEQTMHDMMRLQHEADILMTLQDPENIDVLAVRGPSKLPVGVLPIVDMQKYLQSNQGLKASAKLAVMIVPMEFRTDQKNPDLVSIVQAIDKILLRSGVKRRVYECYDARMCLKLDSADSDAPVLPKP